MSPETPASRKKRVKIDPIGDAVREQAKTTDFWFGEASKYKFNLEESERKVRALEEAERTCKAANESQRRSIVELEAVLREKDKRIESLRLLFYYLKAMIVQDASGQQVTVKDLVLPAIADGRINLPQLGEGQAKEERFG